MINIENITIIFKNVLEKLKNLGLDYKNKYNLYSDEGGFFGNPKFFITNKINNKIPYSTYHGKMTLSAIKDYIIGRLCTWQIGNNKDYSELYKIIKL